MGLADEIENERRAKEQAKRDQDAWNASQVSTYNAAIVKPPQALAPVLVEAARLLKYRSNCWIAAGPDRILRVSFDAKRKTLFGDYKDLTNQRVELLDVTTQGKDSPNARLAMFADGLVAFLTDTKKMSDFDYERYIAPLDLEAWRKLFAKHFTR